MTAGRHLVERLCSTHICLTFTARKTVTQKMLVLTSNYRYQRHYRNMHKIERLAEMRSFELPKRYLKYESG